MQLFRDYLGRRDWDTNQCKWFDINCILSLKYNPQVTMQFDYIFIVLMLTI